MVGRQASQTRKYTRKGDKTVTLWGEAAEQIASSPPFHSLRAQGESGVDKHRRSAQGPFSDAHTRGEEGLSVVHVQCDPAALSQDGLGVLAELAQH